MCNIQSSIPGKQPLPMSHPSHNRKEAEQHKSNQTKRRNHHNKWVLSSAVIHEKAHFYTIVRAGPTSDQFIIANDEKITTISRETFYKIADYNACAVTYIRADSKLLRYRYPELIKNQLHSRNKINTPKNNEFIVWGPHRGIPITGIKTFFALMGLRKFAWSECRWEGDRMSHCKNTMNGVNKFHLRISPKSRLSEKEFDAYNNTLRVNGWRAIPVDNTVLSLKEPTKQIQKHIKTLKDNLKKSIKKPTQKKMNKKQPRKYNRPSREYSIRVGSWNVNNIFRPGKIDELASGIELTNCHF